MQRWLSDDTGMPFIVNFSSAQAEPGNNDGYGENVNCMRSHTGISKPELNLHVYMRKTLKVILVIEYQCQHFNSPKI